MNEIYIVKMIYKSKEITREIVVPWGTNLDFVLNCLYPEAKILSFYKKIK